MIYLTFILDVTFIGGFKTSFYKREPATKAADNVIEVVMKQKFHSILILS